MNKADPETLLARAIAPQRPAVRAGMLCAAVAAVAGVCLLGLSGWFITGAALAGLGGVLVAQSYNYMLPSALIRLLAILRTASRYGERYYSHKAALLALATVRARLFDAILAARDARAWSAGEAVAGLVQDIGALEDRLVRKPALPAALAGGGAGLALTLLAGPWAALALLAILILLPWATLRLSPPMLNRPAAELAGALGRLKTDMIGYAQASPEIVAYGMAPALQQALEAEARTADRARLRLARGEALIGGLLTLGGGVAMAAALLLSDGPLPLRVLAALASAGAVESLGALVRGIMRDAVVGAGLERLRALAAQGEAGPASVAVEGLAGETLELSTPSGPLLLKAGERLAIIGPSGSGKTRLAEGLAGIRPQEGSGIRIDGHALADLPPDQVRALFALSPQEGGLLSGTVLDNLRLARPGIPEAEMWEALEAASLAQEVRAMPDGLNQWLGDGGMRLSGGQRKRLSIARALLAGRRWLVLDEPSEGLDAATETRLMRGLDGWLRRTGAGLILITHRPAPLALCERRFDLGAAASGN